MNNELTKNGVANIETVITILFIPLSLSVPLSVPLSLKDGGTLCPVFCARSMTYVCIEYESMPCCFRLQEERSKVAFARLAVLNSFVRVC